MVKIIYTWNPARKDIFVIFVDAVETNASLFLFLREEKPVLSFPVRTSKYVDSMPFLKSARSAKWREAKTQDKLFSPDFQLLILSALAALDRMSWRRFASD